MSTDIARRSESLVKFNENVKIYELSSSRPKKGRIKLRCKKLEEHVDTPENTSHFPLKKKKKKKKKYYIIVARRKNNNKKKTYTYVLRIHLIYLRLKNRAKNNEFSTAGTRMKVEMLQKETTNTKLKEMQNPRTKNWERQVKKKA